MANDLRDELIVAAVAPFLTAVFGLIVANVVTARAQRRREVRETREALVSEVAGCATALYLELQAFWRSAASTPLASRGTSPKLAEKRNQLGERYTKERLRGQLLEQRLIVCFADPTPRRRWHATMDLLSTRYLLLLEGDPTSRRAIRKRNAGEHHTGLTEDELKNPKTLLAAIRRSIAATTEAVWTGNIDPRGRHLDDSASFDLWHSADGPEPL